ncbi:MAG: phage tail protein [Terracidiphilus sp.]|jgi:microcystin-dependent protein
MCITGTIVMWGGEFDKVPAGWLPCDGRQVSQETYSKLYGVIGLNFGDNPISGNFYLPDLQGRFVRGADNGAGRDPDVNTRTDMQNPNAQSKTVGSVQDFAFQLHFHNYLFPSTDLQVAVGGLSSTNIGSGGNVSASTGPIGNTFPDPTPCYVSTETRPLNAYLNFIIAY